MPYFLSDKRYEWMQQFQALLQNIKQAVNDRGLSRVVVLVQGRLFNFKVPVAEFVPYEMIDASRGIIEAVIVKIFVYLVDGNCQPAQNPLAGKVQLLTMRIRVASLPIRIEFCNKFCSVQEF